MREMNSDPTALGLPHREPFLFVDRIVSLNAGESAEGEKTFCADDTMFRGHFPGQPIVPGVILTEALAQVAGIAGSGTEGRAFLLSAIRAMKFPAPAFPGELLTLRARKTADFGALVQFDVEACFGEKIVAKGSLILNESAATPR